MADPGTRTAEKHNIPSLDGLRAASIFIVVLAHSSCYLPHFVAGSGLFRCVIGGGLHGVEVFFVISGFLITTLLVRERQARGSISLKRFYLRRTLRIFPPFYAYLAVLSVLWIAKILPEHPKSFIAASTYTISWMAHPQGWAVEHAWSLSIEEQFYLIWPVLLVWAARRSRALFTSLAFLAVTPLVRMAAASSHIHDPAISNHFTVITESVDTLMVGCLLALVRGNEGWENWRKRWINSWTAAAMTVTGFALIPYAAGKLTHGIAFVTISALAPTLTAVAMGWTLIYLVENRESIAGRILNIELVRHIGVISYGIYLWQELFTLYPPSMLPLGFLGMFVAAEASYWCLERPLMRLRARLR